MKTQEQIERAISKMENIQKSALERVAELDLWIQAGLSGKDEKFVSAVCIEKVEQKTKAEKASESIKILKWVLDNN
jgi:hypothetical protein